MRAPAFILTLAVVLVTAAPAAGASGVGWDRTWGLNVDTAALSTGPEVCTVRTNCRNGTPGEVGGAVFPQGLAVGAGGHVFATEYAFNRVQEFDATGAFVRMWGQDVIAGNGSTGFEVCTVAEQCKAGTAGGTGGAFQQPHGIATDAAGRVYVSDAFNHRVQEFTATGGFVRAWGRDVSAGTAGDGLEVCTVAADCKAGVVTSTASGGGRGGYLAFPAGIAVDAGGYVYVANQSGRRIERFTPAAAFDRAWGQGVVTGGSGPEICTVAAACTTGGSLGGEGGDVGLPVGVAVDADANVYVFEAAAYRVEKFTAEGAFLRAWGKDVDAVAGGTGFEICTVATNCKRGETGTLGGEFLNPSSGPSAPASNAVAVDGPGTVYVTDREASRVQAFSGDGAFLRTWGTDVDATDDPAGGFQTCSAATRCGSGSPDPLGGGMDRPTGVAATTGGTVYEGDQTGWRIQAYSPCPASVVRLASAAARVDEGAGSVALTLERAGDTSCAATVRVTTEDGTATAGADYTATDGTVSVPAGATSQTVLVPILDDTQPESDETFTVTLSGPGGGATLGTPSSATVTIADDDPIDTIIRSGPEGFLQDRRFRFFVFDADPATGATFACALDGAPAAPCTSPFDPGADVAEGPHTFSVRATSGTGDVDPSPATRTFTVDTVRPVTTASIEGTRLASGVWSGRALIRASASDPAPSSGVRELRCAVDTVPAPQTASELSGPCPVSVTQPGRHTVYAAAVDEAGNAGIPASVSFVIAQPPETEITSGPAGSASSLPASFAFRALPGGSLQCALDNAVFSPCSSPVAFGALALGPHTFRVRAVSPEGEIDPTPASRAFTLEERVVTGDCGGLVPWGTFVIETRKQTLAGDLGGAGCTALDEPCPTGSRCTLTVRGTETDEDDDIYRGDTGSPWSVDVRADLQGQGGEVWGSASGFCRSRLTAEERKFGRPVCPRTVTGTATGPRRARATCRVSRGFFGAAFHVRGRDDARRYTCRATLRIEPATPLDLISISGTRATVYAPGPGTVTVGTAGKTGARAAGASPRVARPKPTPKAKRTPPPLSTTRKKTTTAGYVVVPLKLSRSSARTLKRKRRVTLAVGITFTPASGPTLRNRQRLTLHTPTKPRKVKKVRRTRANYLGKPGRR